MLSQNITKQQTNANLLKILTKRKAASLTDIKKDWPGKLAPSFTSNIKLKPVPEPHRSSSKQNMRSRKISAKDLNAKTNSLDKFTTRKTNRTTNFTNSIPIARMGASLSIQPSSRSSKNIGQLINTWRTNASNPRFAPENFRNTTLSKSKEFERYSRLNDREEEQDKDEGEESQQIKFGNNRLNTALSRERRSKELIIAQEKEYLQNLKKSVIKDIEYSSRSSQKNQLNNFVVDFASFNYIDKVIDNPELWKKFVRKKVSKIEPLMSINTNNFTNNQ